MPLFYIYSGLIACIVSQVTLGLKNKDFNALLSLIYTFIIAVLITYISITYLNLATMVILYSIMPEIIE